MKPANSGMRREGLALELGMELQAKYQGWSAISMISTKFPSGVLPEKAHAALGQAAAYCLFNYSGGVPLVISVAPP